MTINNSPDINSLLVQVTFDLSGLNPVVSLVNFSSGPNLAGMSWAFIVKSPSGTFIHEGNINSPDQVGDWTNVVLTDAWPRPFYQVEWSGAPYSFQVIAKDTNGTVYSTPEQLAIIYRPYGNTNLSKTMYGQAKTDVKVQCQQARIYFQDQTPGTYQGNSGTILTSVLRVIYPLDPTATIPDPFQIANFSTALVPISYSSDNYQFQSSQVYDYDQGGYVHVRIKYVEQRRLNVLCNIDLCPLVCEIAKLIDDIEKGNCNDVVSAQKKLQLINSKLAIVIIGTIQGLCDVDVPGLIEEIKQIGGFSCDCCSTPSGIIPQTSSVIDGYNFQIVHLGGDVNGDIVQSGTNIQIRLYDKSYIFKICDDSPVETDAFEVIPSTSSDGFTKTYCLRVHMHTLANDILNTIQDNADLLNLFNSLFNIDAGEFDLIVDGGCILQTTTACDYTLGLSNIPASVTFAILSSIRIGSNYTLLNYQFNLTNLPGLQAYLNGLGLGTFVVSDLGGGNIQITSSTNTNDIQQLTYKVGSTTYVATLSKICTGFVVKKANEVVQAIIYYICGLDDTKIKTSADYEICYIDPVDGTKKTTTISAGVPLADFIAGLILAGCNTIDYVINLKAVTCANIKALFTPSISELLLSDNILVTKGGSCSVANPVELGRAILQLGSNDQDFVNDFCDLVKQCGSGEPCAPYSGLTAELVSFNNNCPEIVGFEYNFIGQDINITKIVFGNTPDIGQTVTVEYKLHADSSYTLFSNAVSVAVSGQPTVNPTFTLAAGQPYDIRITNNCSSPAAPYVLTINAPGNPYNVKITSDMAGITLTGVTNIAGYTFSGTLVPGQTKYGNHTAFTAVISIDLSGSPIIVPSNARLMKNGVQADCINITTAGTFFFVSTTFALNDQLEIQLNTGGC